MKKILEAIENERWGKSDVVIVGKRGAFAFERLVGGPERQAHNECLDRIEAAVLSPREMKPYCVDCEPQAPGWYWVAYRTFDPEPMYFDGCGWFEFDCGYEMLSDPHFWLEMEPPEKPEGEE